MGKMRLLLPIRYSPFAARQLAIHLGADIGPDRFDLLRLQGTAPGRHLLFSVEHGVEKAFVVARTQAAQIERHAAAGVAQLVAMTACAIVAVDPLARLELRRVRAGPRRGRN